jgi:hypothetical protein
MDRQREGFKYCRFCWIPISLLKILLFDNSWLIMKQSIKRPKIHIWGAPGIHGELMKLGIDNISERTISNIIRKYRTKPPSQTWQAFLHNHLLKYLFHRSFYSINSNIQNPVRLCHYLSQKEKCRPFQCNNESNCWVDCSTNRWDMSIEYSKELFVKGSR